jgi:hypothetical protein
MSRWIVGTIAVVVAAAAFAAPAYAAERSFVSGDGTDAGTCERQAPCRTFGYAITQAPAGGEIVAVDSAGYGPVTITKSISLIGARGVHAGIMTPSGDAISVNAGTSDRVVLRNLYLNGAKGADNGVVYNSASSLVIEDCVIANFTGGFFGGFGIVRNANSPDVAQLTVADTVLRGNGLGLVVGDNGSGGLTGVEVDHSRAVLNGAGFVFEGGADATITDSLAARNTAAGFEVDGLSRAGRLFMERDTATGNGTGILAVGSLAQAVVSNSTIVDNTIGLGLSGGQLISRVNNTLFGNQVDGAFSGTIPAAYRAP